METVTQVAERHERVVASLSTAASDVVHTLSVTATYLLSEEGRKASLMSGGDGRAIQQLELRVPSSRIHLVSVDRQGVARLKLRPRFEMDSERGIARIDATPQYDAPPTVEELYRAAARNHELETAYYAERTAERTKRRESDRELRETVAEAFLADKGQRAVAHPPPSTKRCYVVTERGRLLFDVATDHGLAKDVPPEAHRRFRADLREKHERNRIERAAQLALHEEKKRFVAEWIGAYATDEQKARHAAGVLPVPEAVEAITDQVFAALADHPRYVRDGVQRLHDHITQFRDAATTVTPADVQVTSEHAKTATAAQWHLVQQFQKRLPAAGVVLRVHRVAFSPDPRIDPLVVLSVLVTIKYGPFTLRREYLAPSA